MTDTQLGYLIGGSVWVLAYIFVYIYCPRLKFTKDLPENVTARNNVYLIKADPNQYNLVGVVAQEYYEARFKMNPINLIKLLVGHDHTEREMEVMSHEITIQMLPVEEQHKERVNHAKALTKYYSCFKGWDFEVVYQWMTEEIDYAREWIVDNIEKVHDLIDEADHE